MAGIWRVEVGLALGRPPRLDTTVFVEVVADSSTEAELTAIALATITRKAAVMAVSALITDWPA